MNEETVGTDIDRQWSLDAEGDISLVRGSDNLSQAIYLRLTCTLNSMNWCYMDYGSNTKTYLGENNNPYTQQKLLNEIKTTLLQDPRINECQAEIKDWTTYMIGILINAVVDGNTTFEEYFIFSNIPRKDDKVSDPAYTDTYIDTKNEYYAKPGEMVTVHCHVMDTDHKRVPVGQVECLIGGYHVNIDNNPQYIADTHEKERGSNTFTFRVPLFIAYGDHDLIFKYKGIYGYNPSEARTTLHVLDRIPTRINFEYPRQGYEYYYANNEDHFKDAVTYIRDYNDLDVTHGEVDYYLDTGDVDDYYLLDFPLIYEKGVLIEEPYYVFINDKLIRYSTKYMFNVRRMFRSTDVMECVSQEGEHIDTLVVAYCYGAYYLISTKYVFGTELSPNTNNKLEVIE